MDRIKETADLITSLNKYKKGQIRDYEFIGIVCSYFDKIKNEKISACDLKFLKYISNNSGVPHFYNILTQFGQITSIDTFDMNTVSAIIYECLLHTDSNNMLHKYQMKILDMFTIDKLNRYFLSASTSFGKTFIVFEIIRKMKYSNIILIFPTIALLSENLERIISDTNFLFLKQNYKIHTLSEAKGDDKRNIFIFTPERYLSFIEKNNSNINIDFVFIDEIYKIDNQYLIDEEVRENERDIAYRLAVHYSLRTMADALLAGPYMDFSKPIDPSYNNSFDTFLNDKSIILIDFNKYEIVNKSYYIVKNNKSHPFDSDFNIEFSNPGKTNRLIEAIKTVLSLKENIIVYCSNRGKNGGVEFYAEQIISSKILENHDTSQYDDLISHIATNFTANWILVRSLHCGIGIHHGLIPKYIQKEIISLFNRGLLKVLISTTTITEGVNTSAKNLVVMHSKKGSTDLKKFDAKNIAGRAGRFGFHYSGRVIDFSNHFLNIIESDGDILKHKNYDINVKKDDIDLYCTHDDFLSVEEKHRKKEINEEQIKRHIPDEIINLYSVVSKIEKIMIYDSIVKFSSADHLFIKKLIKVINYKLDIDYDGFQVIIDVVAPIVTNKELKFLMEYKLGDSKYTTITHLVHYYLEGGFQGSIRYHLSVGKNIDEAIQKTSKFIYNTLKYQTVKYLGVFNTMYKYFISRTDGMNFDDVHGIDRLLSKLEYNALTDEGRVASDYGVPASVVDYYEYKDRQHDIKQNFDAYEKISFERVEKVINND